MKRRLKQMPVEKPVGYFVLFYAKEVDNLGNWKKNIHLKKTTV